MIPWFWLIPAFFFGLAFGWLIAALCVMASRSEIGTVNRPYLTDDEEVKFDAFLKMYGGGHDH
jgi:hypothetical protein